MLEQLSICRYRVMQSLGENPCSAANQQERLPMITMLEESSETTRQTHCILSGEDIVRSAWRHAANKMPKVNKSCLSKIWPYAGITEYLLVLIARRSGSENLTVQSISRKDWCKPESSETTRQTPTLSLVKI